MYIYTADLPLFLDSFPASLRHPFSALTTIPVLTYRGVLRVRAKVPSSEPSPRTARQIRINFILFIICKCEPREILKKKLHRGVHKNAHTTVFKYVCKYIKTKYILQYSYLINEKNQSISIHLFTHPNIPDSDTHTHTDYRSKMAAFLWRFCGFVRPSVGSLSLALGEAESPGWLFNELFSFSTLTCWFVFKVFCNFHLLSETQQVLQQKPSSHTVGFLRGFLVYVCIVGKEWVSVW